MDEADTEANDELAQRVTSFIAQAIALRMQHDTSQAAFTSAMWPWRNSPEVEEAFKDLIPDTYAKAFVTTLSTNDY